MLPFCVAEMVGKSNKVFFQLGEQLVEWPRFGSQHPLAGFLCNASSVVDLLLHDRPGLPCDQGVSGFVQNRLELGANGFNTPAAAFPVQAGLPVVDSAPFLWAQTGITELVHVWQYELTMSFAAQQVVDGFLIQSYISTILAAASIDSHMLDSLRHFQRQFGKPRERNCGVCFFLKYLLGCLESDLRDPLRFLRFEADRSERRVGSPDVPTVEEVCCLPHRFR